MKRAITLTRRDFLTAAGAAATATWFIPRYLAADEPSIKNLSPVTIIRNAAAHATITTQPLRRNISVLLGSGGNIAVLTGPDGKILIDAGITSSRPRISEALAALSNDPITHLINTHWHFDHTDGNEWLHNAGAQIIAHENVRKHLSADFRVDGWNFTFPASPAAALPTTLMKNDLTLLLNDEALTLQYYPPAHTDSDISVSFTNADVIHVGDTWWNGYYPFIDYSSGGSISGSIQAAEANLAKVTSKTIIIPGHGPVGDKSQMTEFRDMLVTIRDKVAALKKQGKSLNETIAAQPTADFDKKWGNFVITPPIFTTLVYQGV